MRPERTFPIPTERAIPALTGLVVLVVAFALDLQPTDLNVYLAGGAYRGDALYEASENWSLPFTYPPIAAVCFTPLAALPHRAAVALFYAIGCACLVRSAQLWVRSTALPGRCAVLLVTVLMVTEPALKNWGYGQVNPLLVWLVAEDLLGRHQNRGALCGVAAAIKLTPAIYGLCLLVERDWRALARACVVGITATLVGALVMPRSTVDFFTRAVVDPGRVGGVEYAGNQSINGLLWRVMGPGGSRDHWLALVALATLTTLWLAHRHSARGDRLGSLACVALLGCLASPVSWSHHWLAALPLVLLLAGRPARAARALAAAWLLALLGWAIWWLPHDKHLEYRIGWVGQPVQSTYVMLGLATLVLLSIDELGQLTIGGGRAGARARRRALHTDASRPR